MQKAVSKDIWLRRKDLRQYFLTQEIMADSILDYIATLTIILDNQQQKRSQ